MISPEMCGSSAPGSYVRSGSLYWVIGCPPSGWDAPWILKAAIFNESRGKSHATNARFRLSAGGLAGVKRRGAVGGRSPRVEAARLVERGAAIEGVALRPGRA